MHKRKKVLKYRGSKTHGGGAMKKRRGAGNRGGRGRAGSGKRGDARKPSFWKEKGFGKSERGFVNHARKDLVVINVSELSRRVKALELAGHLKAAKGVYSIDLTALGVDKLLGTGSIGYKLHVTVAQASARAVDKIVAAGGSVSGLSEE